MGKVRQRHRPWREKRETCEKAATWTDWIPTSSRQSRESRSAILRGSPAVPDVQAIEVLLFRNDFSAAARVRAGQAIEGMVDVDGVKQCNAIHLVAGIFCQRVLAESALRIGPLVDQSMPAFIGPGAGAESNVAEVGGHEKVIIQNSSVRTMG